MDDDITFEELYNHYKATKEEEKAIRREIGNHDYDALFKRCLVGALCKSGYWAGYYKGKTDQLMEDIERKEENNGI